MGRTVTIRIHNRLVKKRETTMASYFFRGRNFLARPQLPPFLATMAVPLLFIGGAVILYSGLHSMAEAIYILPFECLTPEVKARLLGLPREALLLTLLMALVVVLQTILISRRVIGPASRLKRILREMASGQYPQAVMLRNHDGLKEVAADMAFLGQSLQRRREDVLERLDQLQGALVGWTTHVRSGEEPEAVQAQLEELAKQIGRLREIVAEGAGPDSTGPTLPKSHV
jgi:methyl-accepting chemotaxis protein